MQGLFDGIGQWDVILFMLIFSLGGWAFWEGVFWVVGHFSFHL